MTNYKTSIVSLASHETGDVIVFSPAPGTVVRDVSPRMTRRELISGRDVIETRGFSWSSVILTYFANLTNEERKALERMATIGRVAELQNSDGVYIGAIRNIATDSNPSRIEFWVSHKLEDDFTDYGFFVPTSCTYEVTETDTTTVGTFEDIIVCTMDDPPGMLPAGTYYFKYIDIQLSAPACVFFEVEFSLGSDDIYFRFFEGDKDNLGDPAKLLEEGAYESLAHFITGQHTVFVCSTVELQTGDFNFNLYENPGGCV